MADGQGRAPQSGGQPRPGRLPRPALPPRPWLVAGLLVLLATAAALTALDATAARQRAQDDVAALQADLERVEGQLAELRSDLQARQGRIVDLEARATELAEALAEAEAAREDTTQQLLDAEDAALEASEQALAATSLAGVTTAIAEGEDIVAALHVTDVPRADLLVGFDLREMLADGPDAGRAIQVRLVGVGAPAPGDCRHTQSRSLAEAWLEGTGGDVLLRRPDGAPATDALGQQLAEVVAFVNPASSLNVTLVVAGEGVLAEDGAQDHPDLLERLRVAEQTARSGGEGVWACARSDLLGVGVDDEAAAPDASPSPEPTARASATPSPTQS